MKISLCISYILLVIIGNFSATDRNFDVVLSRFRSLSFETIHANKLVLNYCIFCTLYFVLVETACS